VNQRYALLIAAELGPENGSRLTGAYEREAFPLAFEPTRADRTWEALEELGSLSEDQRTAITAMMESFRVRDAAITREIMKAIGESELQVPAWIQHMSVQEEGGAMAIQLGGGMDQPYSELLRDRFDLAKSTTEQMKSILTPDQLSALPELTRGEGPQGLMIRNIAPFGL
jgi:hypothetical protein